MTPSRRILFGFAFFFSISALPASSIAQAAPAGKILYTARFQWKSGDAAPRAMRLVIERNPRPRFTESAVIARILSGGRTEAVCQISRLETGDPAKPRAASVDMTCRSVGLATLVAPATVFFQPGGSPILRFGTWLQGYEQAILTVEKDRSARLLQIMAPSPVRLAESR